MATGAQTWSTSAASNNSADGSVNWAEGMAPSAVNNSARAEMASAAMWIKDNSGTLLTSGSTAAYTVTSKQVSTAVVDGYTIAVNFHASNDASATLNVDGVGAKQIQLIPGTNLSTGDIVGGATHRLHYSSSSTAWLIQGANAIGASAVSSDKIAASSVAYSKIQNVTAGTLLGNGSTSAAAPAELTIGSGLTATSNSISAPAFPPTSAYKNLVLKVTGTSSATLTADYATLATSGSTSFVTLPVSANINLGASGSANQLDTGSLASGTVYSVWAIAVSSTSTSANGLASTSFTTPALPAGYTLKARLGSLVTSTSTASAQLLGTWQFGRRAQIVMGLGASGATGPFYVLTGASGNTATPSFTAVPITGKYAPTTASAVFGSLFVTNGISIACPSTSYGTAGACRVDTSNSNHAPFSFTLESSAIYYASSVAAGGIALLGWDDNL